MNLKGTIIVARDIAHAKLKARLDAGEGMPDYFKKYPVLYAGPAKTPEGYPCGSMGPTLCEYLEDYASPKTKEVGYRMIEAELQKIPSEKVKAIATQNIAEIKDHNRRDFRF